MTVSERPAYEIALTKAKVGLMTRQDSVFFMTLAFGLEHEFNSSIRTARTNGKRIQYNPEFFMSLDHEERIFLILHESMHCALLHMERGKTLDPLRYNIAGDHVINLMLLERGFKMPACGLADKQYSGMHTEEVYKLLPDNASDDTGLGQDLEEPDVPSDQLVQEVQDILIRAHMQAKLADNSAGSIPGEVQIFLNKLLKPKLPWNKILSKHLHTFHKNDYTFRRPNRRFFPQHHLPSLYSENLDKIAIGTDSSGSVTDDQFLRFITETHSVLRMMNPKEITFIQFDYGIRSIDRVKSVKELMGLKFTGRGGTDIRELIDWTNEHKPQLLVVFTDGYFDFDNIETKIPTIWLIHDNPNFTAPFGKVIHYEP